MSLQAEIIAKLKVKPQIDVDHEIRVRIDFLKEHVLTAKSFGLLIAISGGLDSAVVVALCQLATDELTIEQAAEYKTLGVFQPYGEQSDIEDSYAVAKALGISNVALTNIAESVDEMALEVEYAMKSLGIHRHISRAGKGNMKARTRMVMQYALAFEQNLLVVGSDQASETITGFFTKHGDGGVDLNPLRSLNKRQVAQLGEKLGVPTTILTKVPTAGLWEGQVDETELGITYEAINDYLEGKQIDPKVQAKLEKQYLRSEHKRVEIPWI